MLSISDEGEPMLIALIGVSADFEGEAGLFFAKIIFLRIEKGLFL